MIKWHTFLIRESYMFVQQHCSQQHHRCVSEVVLGEGVLYEGKERIYDISYLENILGMSAER